MGWWEKGKNRRNTENLVQGWVGRWWKKKIGKYKNGEYIVYGWVGGEIKNGEHMVYGWVGGKIKKWRTHGLRVGGWENRKNGEYIVYMCVVNPENYS